MTARLIAEEGDLKGLVLSFDEGRQWVIGRDPDDCQFLIEDLAVSRKHALVKKTPDGIILENLSKTNPTLVNDETLTQPYRLRNGDVVKLGNILFRFYSDTETHVISDEDEIASEQPQEEEQLSKKNMTQEKKLTNNLIDLTETEENLDQTSFNDTIFTVSQESEMIGQGVDVNFGLLDAGRWLLKVIGGPNNGAEFSMQPENSYVLGSDSNSCDVVFHDMSVSRQHSKLTISAEDVITIEDLKSRNGTRIDGVLITAPQVLIPNAVVALGTTSFVVYDREGEMQTIISPLLPSIVKVLQKEEEENIQESEKKEKEAILEEKRKLEKELKESEKNRSHALGTFLLTSIIIGSIALMGIATQSLFKQEEIQKKEEIDAEKTIAAALKAFPDVKFSFNKTTGRLLLVGHVLTSLDQNQMKYNLQGLNFIKDIDESGVIIDEYIWVEANQILTKNPSWRGVTVTSPSPGRFVLTGYLQTKKQAEQLWDYISRNFPFLDLLENKVIVDEEIVSSIQAKLRETGFNTVTAKIANGELTLSGNINRGTKTSLDALVTDFRKITGVRTVNNLVMERAPSEAVINISNKYTISGTSQLGHGKLNVIINGRILTEGDVIDGMRITSVTPNFVLLESEGILYRIDISR